jgi:proline racemase
LTSVFVDVPSGRLKVDADVLIGPEREIQVTEVRFENVPAWVAATSLTVLALGREFTVDVSYGGAFYASADVSQLGVTITPENLPLLVEAGRAIKWAINDHASVVHPVDDRLSGCYGTIWFERLGHSSDGRLRQRNVTVFADGEVDRSPCGSGTSARLALLDHHGDLPRGTSLWHQSVVGSTFSGVVLGDGPEVAGRPTVRTQVGGRAHRTGRHEFYLDPADDLGLGFQLR